MLLMKIMIVLIGVNLEREIVREEKNVLLHELIIEVDSGVPDD